MPTNLRVSSLIPIGLIVDDVTRIDDTIFVTARAGTQVAICPLCGSPSRRVCPAGRRPFLLRPGRLPSCCDASILLQCGALPKANIR